ncbi:hypothetical protein B0H11DRAFT_1918732 [Mycena galericulata]|nr:hypothetical protein B0H11DRAFT_1918732 [Mycena galericulata]
MYSDWESRRGPLFTTRLLSLTSPLDHVPSPLPDDLIPFRNTSAGNMRNIFRSAIFAALDSGSEGVGERLKRHACTTLQDRTETGGRTYAYFADRGLSRDDKFAAANAAAGSSQDTKIEKACCLLGMQLRCPAVSEYCTQKIELGNRYYFYYTCHNTTWSNIIVLATPEIDRSTTDSRGGWFANEENWENRREGIQARVKRSYGRRRCEFEIRERQDVKSILLQFLRGKSGARLRWAERSRDKPRTVTVIVAEFFRRRRIKKAQETTTLNLARSRHDSNSQHTNSPSLAVEESMRSRVEEASGREPGFRMKNNERRVTM